MPEISMIKAREILDSRGNPTVEVDLFLSGGAWGRAAVPSGASTGTHEAVELRDGNPRRYLGKGVRKAVRNIEGPIRRALRGRSFDTQDEIDGALLRLDGTPTKKKLGANAILGVSLAFAQARAAAESRPLYRATTGKGSLLLPAPLMNILNGGAHADNGLDVQEFMIAPLGFSRFSEALRAGAEIYHHLKRILRTKGLSTAIGDEGGFAPRLPSNEEGLAILLSAVEQAGYAPGKQVWLSLDVAANELHIEGMYRWEGKGRTAAQMIETYAALTGSYPVFSIEDGLAEEDWAGWKAMTRRIGGKTLLVGDDLYTTNPERLRAGIRRKSSNAILIKPNQIGTVTETLRAVDIARKNRFASIFSHRSGETEDTAIADLAVSSGVGLIKTGAPCRGERVCKYNRLLRIEEELGSDAVYAGPKLLKGWTG